MRDTIWDKRIPTLLGLFIITIGVIITSSLVKSGIIVVGRATPTDNPEHVRITNVSETSFTVSYTTRDAVVGSITFGKDTSLGNTALDDRDQETGNILPYTTHYITVKNLTPNMKYFFTILSGGTTFSHEDLPFEVTTGPPLSERPPSQKPIAGKLVLPNGTNPKESIVYVTTHGTQTLSALVKPDGTYILPLNSIRSEDLTKYATIGDEQTLTMLSLSSEYLSNAKLFAKQTNPVPTITLSQDYDFTLSTTPTASASASIGFPSLSAIPKETFPQIISPDNDQGLNDEQPLFKGTAQPGEEVKVTIHSPETLTYTVTADRNGNWRLRPNKKLSPGQHTISIVTKDASGVLKTITRSFTVYAQGNQVNQSATPSATPTMQPTTPTAIPTPTATIVPTQKLLTTPTPTIAVQITPTPTLFVPLSSPTPTITTLTAPGTGTPPPPGSTTSTTFGIVATVTTVTGLLLFLFTRTNLPL